jgi:hypothetical protein
MTRSFNISCAKILTAEQVAEKFGQPVTWVYCQTRRRTPHGMPFRKVGKYLLFEESEIDDWFLNFCPGRRLPCETPIKSAGSKKEFLA